MIDQWHIQPSEFDKLPYYRIEYMEEDLKELLEAKQKANESGTVDNQDYESMFENQQRMIQKSMPKMPTGFKMPSSFKMPQMPKIKL